MNWFLHEHTDTHTHTFTLTHTHTSVRPEVERPSAPWHVPAGGRVVKVYVTGGQTDGHLAAAGRPTALLCFSVLELLDKSDSLFGGFTLDSGGRNPRAAWCSG